MTKRGLSSTLAAVLGIVAVTAMFALIGCCAQPVGGGAQSASGYLFTLEDGTGTMIFQISDSGDAELNGTTPTFTMGDAGEEDTGFVFDGAAQDFYLALDDSADDLLIGLGSTVGTTGIIYLDESQDVGLGGASAGSKLDVTGNVLLDGSADEVQLTVQGYTTQTSNLVVLEQSDGTDVVTVTNTGALRADDLLAADDLTVTDDATVTGDLSVDGTANLDDVDIDLSASLNIDGHMLDVGTGSCSVADGDNDVCIADVLEVDGEAEFDGAIDADSTANFQGAVTLQGALYTSFTDLAVSDSDTITPTYTTYALDTTGAVTITLNATGTEGQLLVIINDDANATIIADTNLRSSDGNAITLAGAYDVAMFVYQDSEWVLIASSANS